MAVNILKFLPMFLGLISISPTVYRRDGNRLNSIKVSILVILVCFKALPIQDQRARTQPAPILSVSVSTSTITRIQRSPLLQLLRILVCTGCTTRWKYSIEKDSTVHSFTFTYRRGAVNPVGPLMTFLLVFIYWMQSKPYSTCRGSIPSSTLTPIVCGSVYCP